MKTVLITGATSGIGLALARLLAGANWHVLACGRTAERCDAAKAAVLKENPDARIVFFSADLRQQREVNRLAGEIGTYLEQACGGRLDVLISNAGFVTSWYSTTEEGYEQQFALNHLAGFLLTFRLLRYLGAGARVILTGSNSHKWMKIRWNDIMFQRRYNCLLAYKQSKLCNMLFAAEFNRRFSKRLGIKAFVVDPGLVDTAIGCKRTGRLTSRFWSLRRRGGVSPEEAAKTYLWLCGQKEHPEGLYFGDCTARRGSRRSESEADARRLFALSETLCGIAFEEGAPV